VADTATALFVDRLSKVYADGTHGLDALELRLPAGSFFGLLGRAPARPALYRLGGPSSLVPTWEI
jgi:hypothetical protein